MKQHVEKTHCPQGHPYAGDNLIISKRGWRKCRQCGLDYAAKKWREKYPTPRKHGMQKLENPKARRMSYSPTHPLARNGYVLESRMLLYDRIGPGIHSCHWCQHPVQWLPGNGTRRGALTADHLDWNPHNNASENLVPSCQSCNGMRTRRQEAYQVKDTEHFIIRKNGTRVRAVQRECAQCGHVFLIPPAALARPKKGQFCSLSCARMGPRKTT